LLTGTPLIQKKIIYNMLILFTNLGHNKEQYKRESNVESSTRILFGMCTSVH